MKNKKLLYLNNRLEIEDISVDGDENNLFELLTINILSFVNNNGSQPGKVKEMLDSSLVDLNEEYIRARAEGDEGYIQQVMKSKQVIQKILSLTES